MSILGVQAAPSSLEHMPTLRYVSGNTSCVPAVSEMVESVTAAGHGAMYTAISSIFRIRASLWPLRVSNVPVRFAIGLRPLDLTGHAGRGRYCNSYVVTLRGTVADHARKLGRCTARTTSMSCPLTSAPARLPIAACVAAVSVHIADLVAAML